jgi:hypothetical protein
LCAMIVKGAWRPLFFGFCEAHEGAPSTSAGSSSRRMIFMHPPTAVGAMIYSNCANQAACDSHLAKIAEMMPHAGRDQRRRLRRIARDVKSARWRGRVVGWILDRFDPR